MGNEHILQGVINELDEIVLRICDEYCKYPHLFSCDEQEDLDMICKACPLNSLASEGVII